MIYNIFMPANISQEAPATLAEIFRLLGQPVRIQILLTLAKEEACVCHIEACLGVRQAVISQHLMILRDAGLVEANRNGRNIFYRVVNPDLFDAVFQVAIIAGVASTDMTRYASRPLKNCPCPRCNPNMDLETAC
jgi:DNA-binding transcriptional ArsR family regulator